jgi:hypothetical protein
VSNGNVSSANLAATSYNWGGLAPGTYMCFTITAKNSAGQSPWSPYACTITLVPTPTNVTAVATSAGNIHVTWSDSAAGAHFVVSNGNVSAADTAVGATSYDWSGLAPGTYMCFTVAAKQGYGQSPWSLPYACATTPGGDPWEQPVFWLTDAASGYHGDPINVILTATSTVSLDTLYSALHSLPGRTLYDPIAKQNKPNQAWWQVQIMPPLTNDKCISALTANVDDLRLPIVDDPVSQQFSAREGGCLALLYDNVDHFRGWQQNTTGAWFIAASTEYACLANRNHCITGYDVGRDELVTDIQAAASANHWPIAVKYTSEYPAGSVTQPDGSSPTYDGQVAVISLG